MYLLKYIYSYIFLLTIIFAVGGNAEEDVEYYLPNDQFCHFELECFPDGERPEPDDIVDYTWYINNYDFKENDFASYSEVAHGSQKANIVINSTNLLTNNSIAKCAATIQENSRKVSVTKEYTLREGALPSIENTASHNSEAQENTNKTFRCAVTGGIPPPNIMLYFDEEVKSNEIGMVVEFVKTIVYKDFGKEVKCKAISLCNKTIQESVTLKVKHVPRITLKAKEEKPEVGKLYFLKLLVRSYPPPDAYTWWYQASGCSGENKISPSGDHFIIENKTSDEQYTFVATIRLDNVTSSHLNSCLTLEVSNKMGTEEFQTTISFESSDANSFPTIEVVIGVILFIVLILLGFLTCKFRHHIKELCRRGQFTDYELSSNLETQPETSKASHSLTSGS